jgi:hypothetical protein
MKPTEVHTVAMDAAGTPLRHTVTSRGTYLAQLTAPSNSTVYTPHAILNTADKHSASKSTYSILLFLYLLSARFAYMWIKNSSDFFQVTSMFVAVQKTHIRFLFADLSLLRPQFCPRAVYSKIAVPSENRITIFQ